MNEYPLPGSYVATPMERGYSGSALRPPSAVQAADPHGPSCAGAPAPPASQAGPSQAPVLLLDRL